jgi:hypothetical protein
MLEGITLFDTDMIMTDDNQFVIAIPDKVDDLKSLGYRVINHPV